MLPFIADAHLGKLAKALRLLGFDTLYDRSVTSVVLCSLAAEQNRVLLSRSASLAKHLDMQSFIIRSEVPAEQLHGVIRHFKLKEQFRPFTRCLVCNGILEAVLKEHISDKLEQNTSLYFNEFWKCILCQRIYWKGSHYERMCALVKELEQTIG